MPVALTERERGLASSLFERVTETLAVTRNSVKGSARLVFPDGRAYAVEAVLLMSRSAFSSSGEGYIHCDAEIGFSALESTGWLTLSFSPGATAEIEIRDVKARDGQCRCHFEVRS